MSDTPRLLDMSVVTYEVRLSDVDLKARLEHELLGRRRQAEARRHSHRAALRRTHPRGIRRPRHPRHVEVHRQGAARASGTLMAERYRTRDHTGALGRLVNRPLPEIKAAVPANRSKRVAAALGHPQACEERRYADTPGNRVYSEAERAVWLAAARSGFEAEWRFAWKIELNLQRTFSRLDAIGQRVAQ